MAIKLKWCLNKKKGIRLIKPNNNLSKKYLQQAEETLEVITRIKNVSAMWLYTMKYYFRYFVIYAFLMRIGIKSEIHECTLELTRLLEEINILPKHTYENFKKEKEERIESQYYLKIKPSKLNIDELRDFFLTIKEKIDSLDEKEINEIRAKVKELIV